MNNLHVIVDLQFGSCGKGLFAGYLAKRILPDTIVTAWAPNAGHTFMDATGKKWVHTMIPNGVVAKSVKNILIGPGSVINPETMQVELDALFVDNDIHKFNIYIHENAAVVQERHREEERKSMYKIGSTMKGVGAAMCEKILRNTDEQISARRMLPGSLSQYVVTREEYNKLIDDADVVLVEGAQGFSLSLNHGFFPYVTSRDCTTMQTLSDCGIPYLGAGRPYYTTRIYGVCRTYPIRVANRHDPEGRQIGWSGPGYPDQEEIEWASIGVRPELTTVTKLPRRLFTWSNQQVRDAIRMNGVNGVFLNFCNYMENEPEKLKAIIHSIEGTGAVVQWMGFGPAEQNVRQVDFISKGAI